MNSFNDQQSLLKPCEDFYGFSALSLMPSSMLDTHQRPVRVLTALICIKLRAGTSKIMLPLFPFVSAIRAS